MSELIIYKRQMNGDTLDSNMLGRFNTTKTFRVPIYFLEWLPYSANMTKFPDEWTPKDLFTNSAIQTSDNIYYRALNYIYLSSVKNAISSIIQIPRDSFSVGRIFYENKKRNNILKISTSNSDSPNRNSIIIANPNNYKLWYNTGYLYAENALIDLSEPSQTIYANSGLSMLMGTDIDIPSSVLEIPNVQINLSSGAIANIVSGGIYNCLSTNAIVLNNPMQSGVCSDYKLLGKEDISIILMQGLILNCGTTASPTLFELYYKGSLRTVYYAEMEVYGRNAITTVEAFIAEMVRRINSWLWGDTEGDSRD